MNIRLIKQKAVSCLEAFRGEHQFNANLLPDDPEELAETLIAMSYFARSVSATLYGLALKIKKEKRNMKVA